MNYILGFDVGVNTIRGGIVTTEGSKSFSFLESTYKEYPIDSFGTKEEILSTVMNAINDQLNNINDNNKIYAICFAIPGPFDYEKGISLMKRGKKYGEIFGVDLKMEIRLRLNLLKTKKVRQHLGLYFMNDANAFAIGEAVAGEAQKYSKVVALTLGSGFGSTFLKNRKIIKGKYGIPMSGMIYNEKFLDGVIDDYAGKKSLLQLAKDNGFDEQDVDIDNLNKLAETNPKARNVFEIYGKLLGKSIDSYVCEFQPDTIVIGGKISNAYRWFGETMRDSLTNVCPDIRISKSQSRSSILGAAYSYIKSFRYF